MTRDVPSVRLRRELPAEPRDRSLFNRRRFQFAGALLVGALVPWAVRGPLLPGRMFEHASLNTLAGNAVAVVIAFWLRLSIEIYPGIRRSAVILPATLTGHGTIVAWFLLTRLPYDRIALLAGFVLHMVWLYLLYIYADRKLRRNIGVVPFGAVDHGDRVRGGAAHRLAVIERRAFAAAIEAGNRRLEAVVDAAIDFGRRDHGIDPSRSAPCCKRQMHARR